MITTEKVHGATERDVRELWQTDLAPCVTLLLPLHPVGRDADQDPLVFKNLVGEARDRLVTSGTRGTEADRLLEPVRQRGQDPTFFRNGSRGLIVCLAPDIERTWHLPFPVGPLVTVGDRFQIKPLLPLITDDEEFFLLALSRKAVRVFHGTQFAFDPVTVSDLPTDQKSFLRLDDPQQQLQYRTASARTGAAGGRRGAMIHGHGVRKDEDRVNLERYVHAIEVAVSRFLADRHAPLILAGVEDIVRAYQARTTYREVMREFVSGNPDGVPGEELHRQAWSLIAPRARSVMRDQAAYCAGLLDTGHAGASARIETILPEAAMGHVETVFVAIDTECWGWWDATERRATVGVAREARHEDLLNVAVGLTLQHGGAAYVVQGIEVPGGSQVAALFRY